MKKLLLVLLGIMQLNYAMELAKEAIAGTAQAAAKKEEIAKDKERIKQSSSSSGSEKSDSSDQVTILDRKIILRTLELDKMTIEDLQRRMAQYESEASAKRTGALLSAEGKKSVLKGSANEFVNVPLSDQEKKMKHRSVIYISPLKIPEVNNDPDRDIEKGEKVKLTDQDYKIIADHFAKERGTDPEIVKGCLASKLKELNETPPDSPKYDPNVVHALATYRKAMQVQKDSHSHIETARKASPTHQAISRSADQSIQPRGPTIKEVIEHELGANAGEILETITTATIDALTQKVTDAKSTQKKTIGVGSGATAAVTLVTGLITYFSTKQHC